MRKRWKFLIALLLIALAFWMSWPNAEPRYGGHRLSYWVDALPEPSALEIYGPPQKNVEAATAINAIGTNAVPFLLEWTRYDSTDRYRKVAALQDRLPAWVRNNQTFLDAVLPSRKRWKRASHAAHAFRFVGAGAACAVPELYRRVGDASRPSEAILAIETLAFIGPSAAPAFAELLLNPDKRIYDLGSLFIHNLGTNSPLLLPLLMANVQQPDANRAELAVIRLDALQLDPDLVAPVFASCLSDPRRRVRLFAAEALASLHQRARSAVPELRDLLNDTNEAVRNAAEKALLAITPEVLSTAPQP